MFIDLYRSNLTKGYDHIQRAQAKLPAKFRDRLLRAYSRRWAQYNQRLQRARRWKSRSNGILLLLSLALVSLCGAGFWLSFSGDSNGLVLFCMAAALGLVFIAVGLLVRTQPARPEDPVGKNAQGQYSQLKKQLFPDLTESWLQGLATRIPTEAEVEQRAEASGKYGLIGEFNLVRALAASLPGDHIILHGLMQKPRDDLDVMVIAPSGIWLFEVKYLNAAIVYREGDWAFWQYNHENRQTELVDHGEPPDQQWLRMRDEIRRTLAYRGRDLATQFPLLGEIRGGIVFAHPQASYDIEKSPPFAWGRIPAWIEALKAARPVQGLPLRVRLQFLELLLDRHQELNPEAGLVSMEQQATRLIQQAEDRIKAWIKG